MKFTISVNNQIETTLPGKEKLNFSSDTKEVSEEAFYMELENELRRMANGRYTEVKIKSTIEECKKYLEKFSPVTIGAVVFQIKK